MKTEIRAAEEASARLWGQSLGRRWRARQPLQCDRKSDGSRAHSFFSQPCNFKRLTLVHVLQRACPPRPKADISRLSMTSSARANTSGEIVKPCCVPKKASFLIRLVGLGFLARPKAAPHCSQALGLFIEIINFFIEPRQFGFRRVGTSQLVKRLTDGKFGFSHDNLTFSIKGYPPEPIIDFERARVFDLAQEQTLSIGLSTSSKTLMYEIVRDFASNRLRRALSAMLDPQIRRWLIALVIGIVLFALGMTAHFLR